MASKSKYPGPPEVLELYEALVGGFPDVERKGATSPYTSRNGHMFSFLDKSGLFALRLSDEDRGEFLAEHDTPPVEQHGREMKGYVEVPRSLLEDAAAMNSWFSRGHEYIGTLKPKPTKKAKKK